jgi:hypothetical protein
MEVIVMSENRSATVIPFGIAMVVAWAITINAVYEAQKLYGNLPPVGFALGIGFALVGCSIGTGIFMFGLLEYRKGSNAC